MRSLLGVEKNPRTSGESRVRFQKTLHESTHECLPRGTERVAHLHEGDHRKQKAAVVTLQKVLNSKVTTLGFIMC